MGRRGRKGGWSREGESKGDGGERELCKGGDGGKRMRVREKIKGREWMGRERDVREVMEGRGWEER